MTRALALALALALAAPSPSAASPSDPAAPSKKDRERAAKSPRKLAPPRPGAKPARLVNLFNAWTHEWLAVAPGAPPPRATLDRFLRDHYTNVPTTMEPKLLDVLLAAAQDFRSDVVMVVSAYRHPKYNLILRKKGHQVARDSNHTKGNAVDFYIPKVATTRLHAWAKARKLGGVGLYLSSGFIHMDTGPIRFWSGE
jgi:hypothetical protein